MWLYRQVASSRLRNTRRTHWHLMRLLFTREFVWSVPNDDNRLMDGIELRYEFLNEAYSGEFNPDWMDLECSVLEMLVAFARRLSFETEREPRAWFWEFMENLELHSTDHDPQPPEEVNAILDIFLDRKYDRRGNGGLFPLRHTKKDQRKIEIWYQFCEYIDQ